MTLGYYFIVAAITPGREIALASSDRVFYQLLMVATFNGLLFGFILFLREAKHHYFAALSFGGTLYLIFHLTMLLREFGQQGSLTVYYVFLIIGGMYGLVFFYFVKSEERKKHAENQQTFMRIHSKPN